MSHRRSLRAGLALVVLAHAGHAAAFCRARTCDPTDPAQACEVDADGCVASGQVLHWAGGCVSFAVQRDGSPKWGLDADTVNAVAERAFSAWLGADCGGRGPSLVAGSLGAVACDQSRYNEQGKNANIVVFRDDVWPHPGSTDAYGYTTIHFDPETGEIFDADIEINSADFAITADRGTAGVDLESILTHEFGHLLGFAHAAPDDTSATMRAAWDGRGEDLRTLTADDAAAMCDEFPPDRAPQAASCLPRHGFSSDCDAPLDEPYAACTLARTPRRAPHTLPLLLFVASVLAACCSRRRGSRHHPNATRRSRACR